MYPLRDQPTEHRVETRQDLQQLEDRLQGLVGQHVLRADRHYGDELSLELGASRPYDSKLLADVLQGSWQVTTQGSVWKLYDDDAQLQGSSDDPDHLQEAFEPLRGAGVARPIVSYPELGLLIPFSNGWSLRVEGGRPNGDELHNWVMFDDANGIIMSGPGKRWFSGTAD